jgi:Flp pilus assembly pilin Flp
MRLLDATSVRVQNAWFAARDKESGQTLTEYSLIIALIAVATVASLGFFGGRLVNLLWQEGSSVGNTT